MTIPQRPTVYIVQEILVRDEITGDMKPKYNLGSAAVYGNPKVILTDRKSILSPKPAIFVMQKELKNFKDQDYILPIGNPAFVAVAGALAARFNNGRFKMLVWEKRAAQYIETQIEL